MKSSKSPPLIFMHNPVPLLHVYHCSSDHVLMKWNSFYSSNMFFSILISWFYLKKMKTFTVVNKQNNLQEVFSNLLIRSAYLMLSRNKISLLRWELSHFKRSIHDFFKTKYSKFLLNQSAYYQKGIRYKHGVFWQILQLRAWRQ